MLDVLRKRVVGEEFDYQVLIDVLSEYDRPRDKIRALLKKGSIIRVKKGLYVFGEALARKPYSREVLANLIYGPSYISLDYALHYHGLIPERVETVTSCSVGRGRLFSTPIGRFSYRQIPATVYPLGVRRIELDAERSFLLAAPEKALADKLHADREGSLTSAQELESYLTRHLRIDRKDLSKLDGKLITQIADHYSSRKIRFLAALVGRLRKGSKRHE